MNDGQKLKELNAELSWHLVRIKQLWTKDMLVTLVVRDPDNTEAEIVVGDDSMDQAIAAIERARERPVVE